MRAHPLCLGNAALGLVLERIAPAAVPELHFCRLGRVRRSSTASKATAMTAGAGAYIPQVEVGAYEEQLTAKTQRLQEILREFQPLPEIEVCRCSAC